MSIKNKIKELKLEQLIDYMPRCVIKSERVYHLNIEKIIMNDNICWVCIYKREGNEDSFFQEYGDNFREAIEKMADKLFIEYNVNIFKEN